MGPYIMLISCCIGCLHKQKGHRNVCEVRFVVSIYQEILQHWRSFAQEKSNLHEMDTLHNHPHDLLPPCTFLYSDFIITIQLQSWTTKAHLFCGHGYSYLGHDRNASKGLEMLENLYLEYIEEIGTSQSA